MSIPPQLMLLLKTLVHVEGLGRDLYPDLDIWSLAKPILSSWIKEQLDPMHNLQQLRAQLPEILLSATDIPRLLDQGLQSLASQGSRQDSQLREIQHIRADMLNDRRRDWVALAGFGILIALATQVVGWLAPIFYILAGLAVVWRILA
jgi:ubiquinone biosynthesis protein